MKKKNNKKNNGTDDSCSHLYKFEAHCRSAAWDDALEWRSHSLYFWTYDSVKDCALGAKITFSTVSNSFENTHFDLFTVVKAVKMVVNTALVRGIL